MNSLAAFSSARISFDNFWRSSPANLAIFPASLSLSFRSSPIFFQSSLSLSPNLSMLSNKSSILPRSMRFVSIPGASASRASATDSGDDNRSAACATSNTASSERDEGIMTFSYRSVPITITKFLVKIPFYFFWHELYSRIAPMKILALKRIQNCKRGTLIHQNSCLPYNTLHFLICIHHHHGVRQPFLLYISFFNIIYLSIIIHHHLLLLNYIFFKTY